MAGIVLLISRAYIRAESRDIRSRSLEIIKGLEIRVIREVVVETEILPGIDVMVEPDCELILSIGADGYCLIDTVGTIRGRDEAEHVDCDRILTVGWDYVRRKDCGPRERALNAETTARISAVDPALREAQGCIAT